MAVTPLDFVGATTTVAVPQALTAVGRLLAGVAVQTYSDESERHNPVVVSRCSVTDLVQSRTGYAYVWRGETRSEQGLASEPEGIKPASDDSSRDFADSLRRIQMHSGLSWGEISRTLGVSRRTVHNWLSGSRVSGVNALRVAGLYKAITQELTNQPRESARSYLLSPSSDGSTRLGEIGRWLRELHPADTPVLSGFELLRVSESAEGGLRSGGWAAEIPAVPIDEEEDD